MTAPPSFSRTVGNLAMNLLFYTGFILLTGLTIVCSPPVYIILRLGGRHDPGQAVRRIIWFYGKGWVRLVSLFVPFQITHGPGEPLPGTCIVVANHLSFFDAFCLGILPMYNLVFAVRSWPFRIPFYGPYMHTAKYLNTERMCYEEFLSQARERLENDMTLIIFPEGTRSASGQMGRFHSGAFKLAIATGFPILPVCITGTGRFLPKGKFRVRRHSIGVHMLPLVHPENFDQHDPLAHLKMGRQVKSMIAGQTMLAPRTQQTSQ
ncbi:lysophospholipid acyltransferase family protein [Desulfoplanes sp.]